MKTKFKIRFYNMFTVIFALFTFISVGEIATGENLVNTFINILLFSMATYFCYSKENECRCSYMRKRKFQSTKLSVVNCSKTNRQTNVA